MVGINIKVEMERTLYLDLPNTLSEEEIIEKAKQEVILPTSALYKTATILKKLNINIPQLDLKDWRNIDIKYEIVK